MGQPDLNRFRRRQSLTGLFFLLVAGCLRETPQEVVVYAALDKEFSYPQLAEFAKATGIRVLDKYDVESNKTVGLANTLLAEASRPRADVFWNNEILHTLRLERAGLLDTYLSPQAAHYPAQFVSSRHTWHGFAARARVLIVNTDLLPDRAQWPTSVRDLGLPIWRGKCGLAKPLFGTTATHAAVLFASWGRDEAEQFFRDVQANARIEGGNKQVAQRVAQGHYAFGLTDTDDALIEQEAGRPVAIVFPDQADDQTGALLIPNTLGIMKGGPHPAHARKLVDYLLSAEVEARLARGASAQIPLSRWVQPGSRIAPPNLKIMPVDFYLAAEQWETAQKFLLELFQ